MSVQLKFSKQRLLMSECEY